MPSNKELMERAAAARAELAKAKTAERIKIDRLADEKQRRLLEKEIARNRAQVEAVRSGRPVGWSDAKNSSETPPPLTPAPKNTTTTTESGSN